MKFDECIAPPGCNAFIKFLFPPPLQLFVLVQFLEASSNSTRSCHRLLLGEMSRWHDVVSQCHLYCDGLQKLGSFLVSKSDPLLLCFAQASALEIIEIMMQANSAAVLF